MIKGPFISRSVSGRNSLIQMRNPIQNVVPVTRDIVPSLQGGRKKSGLPAIIARHGTIGPVQGQSPRIKFHSIISVVFERIIELFVVNDK